MPLGHRSFLRGRSCGSLRPCLSVLERSRDEQPERTTPAELDTLRNKLRAALNDSTPARAKTTLQAMIDGIRVHARDNIEPTFRVPAVRIDCGYMELGGLEPPTSWVRSRRSPN